MSVELKRGPINPWVKDALFFIAVPSKSTTTYATQLCPTPQALAGAGRIIASPGN